MSTSCDTSKKTRLCGFSYRHRHFSLTTVLHLTQVECNKAPHLPRKMTWAHLVTRRKRHVCATFPIGTATFTLRSVKINVFLRVFLWTYCKIDVSCEASVDFHDVSQNATPATEFAPCHHFAQRWQCDSQKTRSTTRLKCCACPEKCNTSSENVGKVLRLPNKTTFGASWNMLECHKVPWLPRKTTWPHLLTRQKSHVVATFPIGTATLRPRRSQTDSCKRLRAVANGCKRLQTVANGCKRLQTVADARSTVTRTRVNPQTPKCKTRTLRYFGKKHFSIVPPSPCHYLQVPLIWDEYVINILLSDKLQKPIMHLRESSGSYLPVQHSTDDIIHRSPSFIFQQWTTSEPP